MHYGHCPSHFLQSHLRGEDQWKQIPSAFACNEAQMSSLKTWMVDETAASVLGIELGLDLNTEQLRIIAKHMAEHRITAFEWAAVRIPTSILSRLHKARLQEYERRDAGWSDGNMAAQETILTMTSEDLLDIPAPVKTSKGHILRTMIRQARKTLAA
jgi:hypothetical protein